MGKTKKLKAEIRRLKALINGTYGKVTLAPELPSAATLRADAARAIIHRSLIGQHVDPTTAIPFMMTIGAARVLPPDPVGPSKAEREQTQRELAAEADKWAKANKPKPRWWFTW